jgi:DNA-binding NarL/FixJ family response regulator
MLRIFIVSSYLMFSLGLENLLRQDKEIKILGQETDREKAILKIQELQPDVVIVYTDDSHAGSRSLEISHWQSSPAALEIKGVS